MVVLADSSVWIAHLRAEDMRVRHLLATSRVLGHSLISGEIAVGNPANRHQLLQLMDELPKAVEASNDEVREFLELHKLYGRGVGFMDLHLLLSVRLTQDALLWTRDRRLHEVAQETGFAYVERETRMQ